TNHDRHDYHSAREAGLLRDCLPSGRVAQTHTTGLPAVPSSRESLFCAGNCQSHIRGIPLSQDSETNREYEKKRNTRDLSREISEDSDVFGAADVVPNNGAPSQGAAVTDSKRTADPKNAWPEASPADPGGRPHLVRLFSRDAPGREDNTFKDRPSESDELQTIQEDSAAAPGAVDAMAAQKRPSQRSKYLASASTMDHARHGFLPRHRDTGILDSLGRFFGSDRGAPKRGSGKVSSEE
uniref:Myelin basic protein n=1 Tax=Ovis aries TaxID=9940 RepID=A0AC11DKK9_SHEEP